MRNIILAATLGATLLVAGCDKPSVSTDINPAHITYVRDIRTRLCFAVVGRGENFDPFDKAHSFSMTHVPCTAEVLSLLRRGHS